ncbi:TIGR02678 family protein [Actinoplanes sp. NPDC051851]|uniref:TIGR02678 family protein n=1 Tax=Actinoplanes sp. NPDC051851 TaxID=3154753 RepID=UPI00343085D4
MRFAADVSDLELADYQRAVRLVLRHPLITTTWPDEKALPRVRRFAAELRRDLAEAFGYRLELHGGTARLVRTTDQLVVDRPAESRTGRPFDRRRYAYLTLCLATLGRAGIQITLSELAGAVAADANRIAGLGLDPDTAADRRAFVDAVAWLEDRGVLRLADGSSAAWASDPGAGEALYDVARDAVFALFRPPRVLQHLASVTALLERSLSSSGNAERRAAAQAARRAVVERPVVYYDDVAAEIGNHLRGQALPADLARLTGLRLERRAEGVLLVDTAGWSAERFPGTGSVAQAAVLLAVAIAERVADPDGRRARRIPVPEPGEAQEKLISQIDAGLPTGVPLPAEDDPARRFETGETGEADGDADQRRLPLITESFLREATAEILRTYGSAFGAAWHADPERLRTEAVGLLTRFGAVLDVPGGVLARPLIGRYRSTVAQVKQRTLF